ncbi:uncharacterized protein LOC134781945 [Penaeus indicus]|uniref:uncharacterized protein LOC134781945 n=1 Tax=Penaeus indicus TaxID=29960 RepID=UPI00300C5D59
MRVIFVLGLAIAVQMYCLFGVDAAIRPVVQREEDSGWEMTEAEVEDERQSTAETIRDAIIDILENVRLGMSTGWPDLNIPPLDPLTFNNFPYNVTWDNNTVYGNFLESELVYLSQFKTTQVLVQLQFELYVNLALELEQLELHGTYDMDGHALGLDVFGDGNYHITLNDVRMAFYLRAGIGDWGRHFQVKEITSDFMLHDADVRFEHLLGGGITGGLVNEALSQELPAVLGVLENLVLPPLMDVLKQEINEYLKQFPLIPDFNITRISYD